MALLDERTGPRTVLAVLSVAVLISLVVAASTSTTAFGAYNAGWEGASGLADEADAMGVENQVILNTTAYETIPAKGTVSFVLAPKTGYNTSERKRLQRFVRKGGTLVVASDFGDRGNQLLEGVGADARFDGAPIRDERYYYRSPAMPIARNVSRAPITAGVEQLTLNHGTSIREGDATVLVRTSEFAYRDANRNGELDDRERMGARPVVTREKVGDGTVIAVSDPSVFINAMLDRSGNRRFARLLFTTRERAVFDYSHAGRQPPAAVALLRLREAPLWQGVLGFIGVGAVALWRRQRADSAMSERSESRSESQPASNATESLVRYLVSRHPDWESARIKRVVEGTSETDAYEPERKKR